MKKLLYILPIALLMGFSNSSKVKIELEFDSEDGLIINDKVITKKQGVATLNKIVGTKSINALRNSFEKAGMGLLVGLDNKEIKSIILQLGETYKLKKLPNYKGSIKLKGEWMQMDINERGFKSKYPDAYYNKETGIYTYSANDMKVEFYFNKLGIMWLIAFKYD